MAQITKDLGGITAYADAVAAGYTGTKAQFETLMASYATVAQNAAASATAAANSKSDAEAFAKGTRNGTPVSSGDAAYENNSKYFAEQAEGYAESLDTDTIARIDGYYDTLGAGTAEQLTSNIYEEDNTPYNFRTSGGSIDIGDRETDMLVGGTVAWNQKVMHGDFDSTTDWYKGVGVDSFSASSNVLTTNISGGSVLDPYKYGIYKNINGGLDATHKYLSVYGIKPSVATTFRLELGGGVKKATETLPAGAWSEVSFVNTPSTYNSQIYFYPFSAVFNVSAPEMTIQYRNAQLFDLTAMFGTTIADYIYSLEQSQAGAGVAWFKKFFPNSYYAYNGGELMSVNASEHNMIGFNMLDAANTYKSDYFRLDGTRLTNTSTDTRQYSQIAVQAYNAATGATASLAQTGYNALGEKTILFNSGNYNATHIRIKHNGSSRDLLMFDIPYGSFVKDAQYCLSFNLVANNPTANGGLIIDECNINLSWDGERDGEYEAYVKHSYPLDSSLTLRGIPKLDNGNLYYDGDTYASDGTVTRKYAQATFSNAPAVRMESSYTNVAYAVVTTYNDALRTFEKSGFTDKYGMMENVYPFDSADAIGKCSVNASSSQWWFGFPVGTTLEQANNALAGLNVVYELATPTTETADPYTNPQIVNDFGTEEYVDYAVSQGNRDVAIPVGHETQYMANLKAKLEMSPSSPEGAGDYIVRQTNGENEYVTLASNATIQNIIARLEALEGGGE